MQPPRTKNQKPRPIVVRRRQRWNGRAVTIEPDPDLPGGFVVRGALPQRWIRQTAFENDEAVGYLADRLNRAGVEEALFEAGAVAGATVVIGPRDNAVVFDWDPTLTAGHGHAAGPRGTDWRLEG